MMAGHWHGPATPPDKERGQQVPPVMTRSSTHPQIQDVITSLENCVRQSAFIFNGSTEITVQDYRSLFQNRRRDNWKWLPCAAAELKIDDVHVDDLTAKLQPVFRGFTHKKTGRFVNGLTGFIGGTTDWAFPTVEGFAHPLIIAAVKVGAEEISKKLYEWVTDGVFRHPYNVVLQGIDIDETLELAEGIRLTKSPALRPDYPVLLPSLSPSVTRLDVIQMSIDCELAPSFCLPDANPKDQLFWTPTETILGTTSFGRPLETIKKHKWLESFCKSMSLVSNSHVDWHLMWRDLDAFEAFTDGPGSISFQSGYRSSTNDTKISQACLEETRRIQSICEGNETAKTSLSLAIDRWVRSKESTSDTDRLIDLRIALEALYANREKGEKAFRVATCGAWHLGRHVKHRIEIRETLRKAYDDSSSVIHGGELKHAVKDRGLVSRAQDICRDGILKRLDETETPKWQEVTLGGGDDLCGVGPR